MRFNIFINQLKAVEWELNLQQSVLMSFCYEIASWAEAVQIEDETFFFASKTKIASELPILTDKADTIYRLLKVLEEKGLIIYKKLKQKDCIKLSEKGKTWNTTKSENFPKDYEEDGKLSDNSRKTVRKSTDKNPTYNNTIDNNTIDNKEERKTLETKVSPAPLYERKVQFLKTLIEYQESKPLKYPKQMIFEFGRWWGEAGKKKMKWEIQDTFEIPGRLAKWWEKTSDQEAGKMWETNKEYNLRSKFNELVKPLMTVSVKS